MLFIFIGLVRLRSGRIFRINKIVGGMERCFAMVCHWDALGASTRPYSVMFRIKVRAQSLGCRGGVWIKGMHYGLRALQLFTIVYS